jgi:hypothetical protein|tara:strand:+ start:245 stop:385 length:141 start_codon:yes stop_codon:yes gene_type:complete
MGKITTPKKQFNSIEDLKKEIKKAWEEHENREKKKWNGLNQEQDSS